MTKKNLTSEELHAIRSRVGVLGGIATLQKYGPEHYIRCGKLGGRPETPFQIGNVVFTKKGRLDNDISTRTKRITL